MCVWESGKITWGIEAGWFHCNTFLEMMCFTSSFSLSVSGLGSQVSILKCTQKRMRIILYMIELSPTLSLPPSQPPPILIIVFIVSKFNPKAIVHKPTIQKILAVSLTELCWIRNVIWWRPNSYSAKKKPPSFLKVVSASWTKSYLRL